MKILHIEVNDNIYEHILFFLKNLPKDMIKISNKTEVNQNIEMSTKEKVSELFENKKSEAFQNIEDPLAWQKSMRDEWK